MEEQILVSTQKFWSNIERLANTQAVIKGNSKTEHKQKQEFHVPSQQSIVLLIF